jgi:predicted cupin superfamily sugar epimerase
MTPQDWMRYLKLKPHPEGGWFRETWRSALHLETAVTHGGSRSACTAIYYLLQQGEHSTWHRLKSDEAWAMHQGRIDLHAIDTAGRLRTWRLGMGVDRQPQALVPAGWWFAAELPEAEPLALMSCFVAPGFDFRDFVIAEASDLAELRARCPRGAAVIDRLGSPAPATDLGAE